MCNIKKNRTYSSGGGILILLRKDIAFYEIQNVKPLNKLVEICGIRITNSNPSIDIYVCYRTPGTTLTQDQWDTITDNVNIGKHSILVGDFNSHNIIWNCKYTDLNGERFSNSIDDQNLFLHNLDSITRSDFVRNIHSNIDLLLSSVNLAHKIDALVLEEIWGSDHHPILFNIQIDKDIYIKKTFKIKSLKTNWQGVQNELNNQYENFLTSNYENLSPHEKYEFIVNVIKTAITSNTPTKKTIPPNKYRNPVSWWDMECNEVKKLRNAALMKWKESLNLEDFLAYKEAAKLASKTFKKKKIEDFKKFASSIDFNVNPKYVWDKCKVFKNKWIKTNKSHYKSHLQLENSINVALDKISPPWVHKNPNQIPICQKNEFLSKPFDFVELNLVLSSQLIP